MSDAFDVFQIDPRYDLEQADLDRRYRRWLAELHPNRKSAPLMELIDSSQSFAKQGELHTAYRQLPDPVTRAALLLERRGQRLGLAQSPELLARIFDQREKMEQALMHGDTSALSACITAARARQTELQGILARHFDHAEPAAGARAPAEIGLVLHELRYLTKLVQRGEQALDDLT